MNKFLSSFPNINKDEEIDLQIFFNLFKRNKKIIGLTSLIFFLIFTLDVLLAKKSWVGEFDIVLSTASDPNSSSNLKRLAASNSIPSNLLKNGNADLNTQVGILKSPSVLMPIFKYVKNEKIKIDDSYNNLTFSNWKKGYLNIALQKETSILKIKYRDTDKQSIIPTLTKISEAYQKYSNRNRTRELESTKSYLIDQIKIYKSKSKKSFKEAQEFAINENLMALDSESIKSAASNDIQAEGRIITSYGQNLQAIGFSPLFGNIDIESTRVMAANQIRNIDIRINKIKKLGNDVEELQFIASTIPSMAKDDLTTSLGRIDSDLAEMRTKYKENDISIKLLKERRKALIKLLQKRSIQYLKAERLSAEALEESASRPKGILIKYREMLRETAMDEKTLIDLKAQLRETNLLLAKIQTPWELITKPTMNDFKFGNKLIIFPLLGVFLGLSIGLLICWLKEKKTDLFYDFQLLEKLFNAPILEIINIQTNNYKINNEEIFFKEIISNEEFNFKFFKSISLEDNYLKTFLRKSPEKIGKNIIQTFDEIKENNEIFLFAKIDKLTISESNQIKNRLQLRNKKLYGIVLFES